MNNYTIIAIDHGNKNTKVLGKEDNNFSFSSGFIESDLEPLVKDNLLIYNGKYYSVGGSRFSTVFDKSSDDRFFILTLAAIGYYLKTHLMKNADIILSVGLPISLYGVQKENFKNYFQRNNEIRFNYENTDYKIVIRDCVVFPQGYSALLSKVSSFKDISAICIDLGGYTSDTFIINKGLKLDVSSARSYNNGVIKLFQEIEKELIKKDIQMSERQIEEVLRDDAPVFFNDDIVQIIEEKAEQYTQNILDKFKETYELKVNPVIFIGGGALLLKRFLESSDRIGYYEFLDEYSNCRGFESLAKKALQMKG